MFLKCATASFGRRKGTENYGLLYRKAWHEQGISRLHFVFFVLFFHPETCVPPISCHFKCYSCSNSSDGKKNKTIFSFGLVTFFLAIETHRRRQRRWIKKTDRKSIVKFVCSVIFVFFSVLLFDLE